MGLKTTIWILQKTKKRNYTCDDLDMATQRKDKERKWMAININPEKRHKN